MNLKYSPNWDGFKGGIWQEDIDVRDFIQKNYTPYEGDESFLAPATEATKTLWQQVLDYKAKKLNVAVFMMLKLESHQELLHMVQAI